jgi:signal peptidase I
VKVEKQAATAIKSTGKHQLCFSNFDERLTVWVDGKLAFGDGLEFASPAEEDRGPCVADLQPAAIIARNSSLQVQHLQLWRDIYYTRTTGRGGFAEQGETMNDAKIGLTPDELKLFASPYEQPAKWAAYRHHQPQHYEVKPGEYFALGDNSTFSSDSRDWDGVPERLLLGRAVFVYWPIMRFGPIW